MPFNSTNKYAFLIVKWETENSHFCLLSKGAPERIWGLCDKVYDQGSRTLIVLYFFIFKGWLLKRMKNGTVDLQKLMRLLERMVREFLDSLRCISQKMSSN